MTLGLESNKIPVDNFQEALELFFNRGWTDGLPVVPPTEERVAEFLDYIGLQPAEVIGEIPERDRVITAEKLAMTTGKAMARMQGFPDYPIVSIPSEMGILDEYRGRAEAVERVADSACERVIAVLTRIAAKLPPT